MNSMNIGQAAAAAGVTPKMIRHYESLGLIPHVDRTEAGYRLYTPREVDMLRFIRQSRALGFSIPQIDSLLGLWRDQHRESRAVKELARQQLAELDARQREIDSMRMTLSGLIENCAGDGRSHCAILDRLATPSAGESQDSSRKSSRTLKEVKAGSSVAGRRRAVQPRPAAEPARHHAALVAWSRSFAQAA